MHLQSANFPRHSPFFQIAHGHADAHSQGSSFAHNLPNQRLLACCEPGDEVSQPLTNLAATAAKLNRRVPGRMAGLRVFI